MQTFKSLFGFLYALLLGSQLFLHTGILLLCRLQSRLSLSLSHLSVLKLVFLRLNHLHLQFSLGFKLHNNLLFQGEFIPLSLQQLVHVLFLCVNGCLEFVKRYLVLLQFLLVHLEIHIVSLQLLLLRLQAPCQRVLFRPVRLQLIDTFLHTVYLRIEFLKLLILGLDFLLGRQRSLICCPHRIILYLNKDRISKLQSIKFEAISLIHRRLWLRNQR